MTEPILASLDELDVAPARAAGAASARATEIASARAAGAEVPEQPAEPVGRDGTRSVTVRLTPLGRVIDVTISQWWRDALPPGRLGAAVLDAYRDALTQAVSTLAAHPPADPARSPHPASPGWSPGRSDPRSAPLVRPIEPGLGYDDWFAEIRRSAGRAAENLERAGRLRRERSGRHVFTGPAGIVRLHAHGGSLTAAEIDVHAALQESPSTVAADALAAFQAAR